MAMTLGLVVHVSAGSVGLISGAVALLTKKGGKDHRLAGKLFLLAMVIMAISGFYLALLRAVNITMLAGALTLYLVLSSWLTVQKPGKTHKWQELATFLLGVLVSNYGVYLSFMAMKGVTDNLGSFVVPATIYYIFTAISVMAVLLDIRRYLVLPLSDAQKVVRHLWRMCIPLYIAASSFFNGQANVFPEVLQHSFYLSLPEYLVMLSMLYWIVRTFWINYRA